MSRSLLIIDIQNDFCEGGSLAVDGGADVASGVTELVRNGRASGRWKSIAMTRDWHIDPGAHWAGPGEEPNFVDTWPIHCQAETHGAAFHENLQVEPDEVFSKGLHGACYSGFEGTADSDKTPLFEWLKAQGTTEVEIVGLATDHCVRATALDAIAAGFTTSVLLDQCAGVAPDTTATAITTMTAAGVILVSS